MSNNNISRRGFLKHGGALASAAGVGMPMVMNMLASSEALAATGGGYKALVCVFLAGGNDAYNTVIRTDKGLGRFISARPTVSAEVVSGGVPRAPLNVAAHPNMTGITNLSLALHPALVNIRSSFEAGRLAIIGNVGPLMAPTVASAVVNGTAMMPPKLSSHNDQTSIWQSGRPEGAVSGWGGEMVRRVSESNAVAGQPSQLFSAVAIEASPVFCAGTNQTMPDNKALVSPFGAAARGGGALRPGGLRGADPGDKAPYTVHWRLPRDLVLGKYFSGEVGRSEATPEGEHLIEADYHDKMKGAERAWEANIQATDSVTMNQPVPDANPLAAQLAVVAKMIKSANIAPMALGRQVFYVQLNGFDTHSGQVGPKNAHQALLKTLDDALKYFDDELGVDRDKVLTFTASEFGRKLNENGDGTDHGWGGHHFVMGGGVKGGVYGYFPDLGTWNDAKAAYGDDQVMPDGTLVPSIPVELYAKELGKWLGVNWSEGSNQQVAQILFPNLDQEKPLMGFTA